MKILFLTDGVHPFQLGGMQKHSLILSRLLAERGIWIHLYHIGGEGYSPKAFMEQYGDERQYIKEFHIPFPQVDRLPGHYLRDNLRYSEQIYQAAADKIEEFDLIYAQGFTAWHFIKLKKKGIISLPILVNFHGFEMFQEAPTFKARIEQKFFQKAVKFNVTHADGVYSFGGKIDQILKQLGVSKDKILLQANGIEENWLVNQSSNEIRNQKRTLTFVGRNERRKGIEELNEALNFLLKRTDLSFIFNFVGPIPKENQITDERVVYHGEIKSSEKIKNILQQSDCLVCPSHSEGMPTVILEAMASGLAIIATDVGAVSRQVKSNGLLLEKPEPEALRKAILEIIEMNIEDLNQMKTNSIQDVQDHFLWDVIADKKITQFKRLLAAIK